ncbi:MAG TPA: LapA family protein [Acidimicrobiales bacterium]|nr:LapA family protein [Acidimicrobiales bacterium]
MDTPVDATGPPPVPRVRRRRPLNPRAVGVLVVVAAVVVFVVQNSQTVTVRFWFVTSHVRLIWIIAACLVVAGVSGFVVGRRVRRRRRHRPAPDSRRT